MPSPNSSTFISWPSGSNGKTAVERMVAVTVESEVTGAAFPIVCFSSQRIDGPRDRCRRCVVAGCGYSRNAGQRDRGDATANPSQ
jgi:hypothetical protein